MQPSSRAPFTVPVSQGPVSVAADRVTATVLVAAAIAATVTLARVGPDARGHGTHEQLGMQPCGWPIQYGIPCPTCGCTTAATQVVHGHLLDAFVTQPFGAVVMLLLLGLGVHAAQCLVRGRSFVDLVLRVPFFRIVAGLVVLLFAAWGYKYLTWPA